VYERWRRRIGESEGLSSAGDYCYGCGGGGAGGGGGGGGRR